jgi:chromate transport protein ChrA
MRDTATIATSRERHDAAPHGASLGEAFRVWTRVAMLSFGDPGARSPSCTAS